MTGLLNRVPGVKCEVGTCFVQAAFTEYVTLIPGDPALEHERHQVDIVTVPPPRRAFPSRRVDRHHHGLRRSGCGAATMIDIGTPVTFLDAWKREKKTGTLIAVRRSVKNPWKVAVIRLEDGAEVEVHPDRLESAGANRHGG